jgi:GNAT superfamily N-acetyltransferase
MEIIETFSHNQFKSDGVFYELKNKDEVLATIFFEFRQRDYVVLESFAVWGEQNKRKGYGSKLLMEAEKKLKQHGYNFITLPEWNPDAEKFYLKVGFSKQKFGQYKKEIMIKNISQKPASSKW